MRPKLTVKRLQNAAREFAVAESKFHEKDLYGVTDGKAVGTYVEHKFRLFLCERFSFEEGNSARGIDFPELNVDMKVTSIRQPQSSCPFKSAKQKIFGLGYSLLIFVYEKTDNIHTETSVLDIRHTIFVDQERTGDFQATSGLISLLNNSCNEEDIFAFLEDRRLPVDEVEALKISKEIMESPPNQGYLTISNALQWRLQYGRVIEMAGDVPGLIRIK